MNHLLRIQRQLKGGKDQPSSSLPPSGEHKHSNRSTSVVAEGNIHHCPPLPTHRKCHVQGGSQRSLQNRAEHGPSQQG